MDKPFWGKLKTPNNGGLTAQMAWNYVRDYSTMATIQLSRIQEDYDVLSLKPQIRREIEIDLGVSDVEAAGIEEMQAVRATADAHFYLNCWRIVALNAYRIAIAIDHAQLHQFIKDQNCSVNRTGTGLYFGDAIPSVTLGWYANGRDQFEHVDERIYGGNTGTRSRLTRKGS